MVRIQLTCVVGVACFILEEERVIKCKVRSDCTQPDLAAPNENSRRGIYEMWSIYAKGEDECADRNPWLAKMHKEERVIKCKVRSDCTQPDLAAPNENSRRGIYEMWSIYAKGEDECADRNPWLAKMHKVFCCSNDSLVNGPNGVDNSSMTSSRDWSMPGTSICFAHLGRLNMQPYFVADGTEYSAWCPPTNTLADYIQVEFASLKTVLAISTQGRVQSPSGMQYSFYTKSYLVRYSNDGVTWTDVMENNSPKIFPGNSDRTTVVTNYLPAPVDTKYIRVLPQSWSVSACLRIDILGCDVTVPSCPTNVFLVNGPYGVDNSSMTSSRDWSVPGTSVCPAFVARLHMQPFYGSDGTEYSSWAPPSNTLTDYLQVEFASLKTVVAVLTQGRAQSTRYPHFVFYTKSYLVRYSNDGSVWTDVMENNSPKVFPGNFDRDTVVTNYLPSPVTAKFVRIVPQSWQSSVCLRIDILGCDASAVESVSVNSSRNGTLWGYAGVANGSISLTNITMNTSTRSNIECVTVCTTTEQCLIASFEKATSQCIGYGTTHIIGSFTPSDPSVMSPDSYNTLYFNYDYAEGLGFTSVLSSGLSYKISDTRKTQSDAQTECQSLSALLITLTHTLQINELQKIVEESPTHANEAGLFVSGFYDGSKYLDSAGVEIPAAFWASSQPDVSKQCVVLTQLGQLSTQDCANTLYFICSLL